MKKVLSFMLAGILPILTACGQQTQNNLITQTEQLSTLNKFKEKAPVISLTSYDVKGSFNSSKTSNTNKENALNKVIHQIDTDIIVFQEVESTDAFKKFSDKYLKDMNYKFYTRDNSSLGKINMTVLSKFPLGSLKVVNPTKNDIAGPALPGTLVFQTKIQVTSDYSFSLLSTYIKPPSTPGYSPANRNADIEQVKEYVRAIQKAHFDERFTVVGNLGNTPDADDLQTMLDPRASGLSLHDVISEDIGKDAFTYRSTKGNSRIDYLLVAAGMFDEYVTGSVNIYKDQNRVTDKVFAEASDHYPVSVKFDLSLANPGNLHPRK